MFWHARRTRKRSFSLVRKYNTAIRLYSDASAAPGCLQVFASDGHARTFNYQAGDVGYVPFAMGHYVQNTGDEPLRFLEIFKDL